MNVKQQYDKVTKEYFDVHEIKLGPWTSASMISDPKHLAFVLARYKFVAKMLEGKKNVLEVGCGDGFGIPIVAQAVEMLYAVDWEERLIEGNIERLGGVANNVRFVRIDINEKPMEGIRVNAIYNIDFMEHLDPEKEDIVMRNMIASYERKEDAVMIIGTPNLTAAQYASPQSAALHINLKSHQTLRELLDRYFHNVFMFGMNDEVLHTGYAPMCHYLFGLGVGLR